jgi:CheY-like chemotaxis protein
MDILIVDDDGDDRDLFCQAVSEIKPEINCIVLGSCEEALQYLRGSAPSPAYIFLDIYMRTMDGKECLLKIKSMKERMRVPVVMYSAALDDENEQKIYKKLGANYFISKPNTFKELKQSLAALFKV